MLSHDIHLRSVCKQTCSTVVPAGTETGMSFTNNSTGGGTVGASVEAFIHPSGGESRVNGGASVGLSVEAFLRSSVGFGIRMGVVEV